MNDVTVYMENEIGQINFYESERRCGLNGENARNNGLPHYRYSIVVMIYSITLLKYIPLLFSVTYSSIV